MLQKMKKAKLLILTGFFSVFFLVSHKSYGQLCAQIQHGGSGAVNSELKNPYTSMTLSCSGGSATVKYKETKFSPASDLLTEGKEGTCTITVEQNEQTILLAKFSAKYTCANNNITNSIKFTSGPSYFNPSEICSEGAPPCGVVSNGSNVPMINIVSGLDDQQTKPCLCQITISK